VGATADVRHSPLQQPHQIEALTPLIRQADACHLLPQGEKGK
ncbi:hypothetical protein HMPREF0185_01910, partial [Brevundimonas diminuta 470-4]